MEPRPLERRLRLACERRREVEVSLLGRPSARSRTHGDQPLEPAWRHQRDDEREVARQQARLQLGVRQIGDCPRPGELAGEPGRLARETLRKRPGPRAARVTQLEAARAQVVERHAGRQEVTHQRRHDQPFDRVLVERRGELAADVEEVLELVDLHRQVPVGAPPLVVDQASLDRRRRRRRQALEVGEVLRGERGPVAARPQAEERDHPPGLHDRAHDGDARPGQRFRLAARGRGPAQVLGQLETLGRRFNEPAQGAALEGATRRR